MERFRDINVPLGTVNRGQMFRQSAENRSLSLRESLTDGNTVPRAIDIRKRARARLNNEIEKYLSAKNERTFRAV